MKTKFLNFTLSLLVLLMITTTSFAQKCESLLKIVQNNTGEFEQTVKEILQTLDFVTME